MQISKPGMIIIVRALEVAIRRERRKAKSNPETSSLLIRDRLQVIYTAEGWYGTDFMIDHLAPLR